MVSEPRTDRTGPPSVRLRRERPSCARVCWHPLRPAPRGAVRTKVVPRHFPPSLIFIKEGVFLLPGPLRAGHIHPILQQRKEEEPRE